MPRSALHSAKTKPGAGASSRWGIWEEKTIVLPSAANIQAIARESRISEAAARQETLRSLDGAKLFVNNLYTVIVRPAEVAPEWPAMIWLSIRRTDRNPVGIERFRHFQRIKNELTGPEHEAVELYPAERRLADAANQYHLFVLASPSMRFPFGFGDRLVLGRTVPGSNTRQQPIVAEP